MWEGEGGVVAHVRAAVRVAHVAEHPGPPLRGELAVEDENRGLPVHGRLGQKAASRRGQAGVGGSEEGEAVVEENPAVEDQGGGLPVHGRLGQEAETGRRKERS